MKKWRVRVYFHGRRIGKQVVSERRYRWLWLARFNAFLLEPAYVLAIRMSVAIEPIPNAASDNKPKSSNN